MFSFYLCNDAGAHDGLLNAENATRAVIGRCP